MKILLLFFLYSSSLFATEVTVERVKKSGLKIIKKENGLFVVQLKKVQLKVGRDFLVVRLLDDNNFDLLAQGKIEANQGRVAYLKLNEEKIYREPTKGDYLIPIGSGLGFDESNGDVNEVPLVEDDIDYKEPGYIQLGFAYNSGDYNTESSTLANSAKVVKYDYQNLHLRWYIEFFWRLGIEYNSYSDDVPTSTYYRTNFDSKRSISDFKLLYRLKKWGKTKLRTIFIANMLSDEFSTSNQDEYLLTTNYNLIGFGTKLNYELYPDYAKLSGFKLLLSKVFISGIYFPLLEAEDVGVSRGTSSKSQFSYQYGAGVEALLFWEKIPYIKLWFINLEYQSTIYDIKFSGPTTSESTGFYTIPEGTTSKEQQDTFKVMIGFRVNDFIGEFFKPR